MLTRRELLALASAVPLAGKEDSRGAMLWNYCLGEIEDADRRRRERLASVRTAADLSALRNRVFRALRAAIRPFPARS